MSVKLSMAYKQVQTQTFLVKCQVVKWPIETSTNTNFPVKCQVVK
jgi:hypothetical protein